MAAFVPMDELPPGAFLKDDGTACFAATKRPDGTMRKERPIRRLPDGRFYVPVDEVKKYQTKGAAEKSSRSKVPVGMVAQSVGTATGVPKSAAAKKTEAKRQRKKEEAGRSAAIVPEDKPKPEASAPAAAAAAAVDGSVQVDEKDALAKKSRALKKKIKAIEDLEAKQAASQLLDADQKAKLAKRGQFELELKETEELLAALTTT